MSETEFEELMADDKGYYASDIDVLYLDWHIGIEAHLKTWPEWQGT